MSPPPERNLRRLSSQSALIPPCPLLASRLAGLVAPAVARRMQHRSARWRQVVREANEPRSVQPLDQPGYGDLVDVNRRQLAFEVGHFGPFETVREHGWPEGGGPGRCYVPTVASDEIQQTAALGPAPPSFNRQSPRQAPSPWSDRSADRAAPGCHLPAPD